MINITVERLHVDSKLPEYAHPGDVGADVFAYVKGMPEAINNGEKPAYLVLGPGETILIPCGIICQLPPTFEFQVRSKSGLAAKESLMVLNSPGTIDPGYRGEIGVILHNASRSSSAVINHGQKIAQLVIAPVLRCDFRVGAVPQNTKRGADGYGSTGK